MLLNLSLLKLISYLINSIFINLILILSFIYVFLYADWPLTLILFL